MSEDWRKSFDVWCPLCGSHHSGTVPNGVIQLEIDCKRCGEESIVTFQNRAPKAIKKTAARKRA